jgi:polysaccharide pyruvyl transferase WcaK-like protein
LQKICIIHVGSVLNKGTHAQVTTEIATLKRALRSVDATVSTCDIDSLRILEPEIKAVPSIVDIPFFKADNLTRRMGRSERSTRYRVVAAAWAVIVILEIPLALFSSVIAKLVRKPFYRSRTINSIQECCLVVSTSGENFREGCRFLPATLTWKLTWWSILFSRMWEVVIVKRILKKPIIVFPNSIGPFCTRIGRWFAKVLLSNVDYILVRDEYSADNLRDLNIRTPMKAVCDIVVLLGQDTRVQNPARGGPLLGVSPGLYDGAFRSEKRLDLIRTLAHAIDAFVEEYGVRVVFLPHEVTGYVYDDLGFSKAIIQEMRHGNAARCVYVRGLNEFRHQLGNLDILLTCRLHPAVLASGLQVPSVSVIYDEKQTGFLTHLGLEWSGIPITELTQEKLSALMGRVWKDRDTVAETLMRSVPLLQRATYEDVSKALFQVLQKQISHDQDKH